MGRETDEIEESSNQPNWQTPSRINAGEELDFASIMSTIGQGYW